MAIDPSEFVTDEAEVWAALRLDLVATGEPPAMAPIDRDFIRALIVAAESRLVRFVGKPLDELEPMPPALAQAVIIDVAAHYFDRLNPTLPPAWDDAIAGHRIWGFGG